MFDTLVVGLIVVGAAVYLVRRFTQKGGGCASCPPGCHCGGKDSKGTDGLKRLH